MLLTEGDLRFTFIDGFSVIKFDEAKFYRSYFNALPNAKGVDFLAYNDETLLLIEVKDCRGYEHNNKWRTLSDNKGKVFAPQNSGHDESFDIEISKKIAMTLACLVGIKTKPSGQAIVDELKEYSNVLLTNRICNNDLSIKFMLFLEGDFGSKTRNKQMIMSAINSSIKAKLKWLNCQTFVEDMDTQKRRYFTVASSRGWVST